MRRSAATVGSARHLKRALLEPLAAASVGLLLGCGQAEAPDPADSTTDKPLPAFADFSQETGLDFVHFNGMSGEYYMAEIISPGAAFFDFDHDGDLDIYLVQGRMLGAGKELSQALFPPRDPDRLSDRLFRNDLVIGREGDPVVRFTDVTGARGLRSEAYGVGVAVGDFDNDGWVDLYVTNLGANQLLRNRGDGTFADVTATTGVGDDGWSVPAVFLDYDQDGWLDLFVGNYVDFPFDKPIHCRDLTGARDYCGPASYPAQPDRLFHNRGDGTFEEVTQEAGLGAALGPALGAVAADFNADSWPDIYVANDGQPNNLWINQRDGTFVDEALLAGCAVNADGKAEGSMGVDAADFDGDGDLDLFMTHLMTETNTFYRNNGRGMFDDHTAMTGLGAPSRPRTGFGTGWLDFDNDGFLDLVSVNGAVKKIEVLARENDPFPLHEPNQLFRNWGNGRFRDVTAEAGEAFLFSEVSRGMALGDVDNDGDTDLLIANNNGPARLLINQIGSTRRWLGLDLVSARGLPIPDARAALVRTGTPLRWGRVRVDGSYCSANDPRILLAAGDKPPFDTLRVDWPDGTRVQWTDLPSNRYTTLIR